MPFRRAIVTAFIFAGLTLAPVARANWFTQSKAEQQAAEKALAAAVSEPELKPQTEAEVTPQALSHDQEILRKQKILEDARVALKKKFVGIDTQIDRIIDAISSWYLLPGLQTRPLIINLWGMTGVGKTSLIRALVEEIGFYHSYGEIDIGELTSEMDRGGSSPIYRYSSLHRKPMIFNLDEFHTARTIRENGYEIPRPGLRVIFKLLSDGIVPVPTTKTSLMRDLKIISEYNGMFSTNTSLTAEEINEMHEFMFPNRPYMEFRSVLENNSNKKERPLIAREALAKIELQMPLEKQVDFTQSIIFVAGNLDEAFHNAAQTDPTLMSADEFHAISKTVTVNNIRKALASRYRLEQISRLGNTHVIYPSFSGGGFRALIRAELDRLSHFAKEESGIEMDFKGEVVNLVYDEGVIPSQGTRPLLSTITELVGARLSRWLALAFTKPGSTKKITVSIGKNTNFDLVGTDAEGRETFRYDDPITLYARDRLRVDPTPLQLRISHRVAAKVVVGMISTGRLPIALFAKTDESGVDGTVRFPTGGVETKRELVNKITILLAARAAEREAYGEDGVSTLVEADIHEATQISARLIRTCGMGKSHIGNSSNTNRDGWFSLASAYIIQDCGDQETLLKLSYEKARAILKKENSLVEELTKYLSHTATIGQGDLVEMVDKFGTDSDELRDLLASAKPNFAETGRCEAALYKSEIDSVIDFAKYALDP